MTLQNGFLSLPVTTRRAVLVAPAALLVLASLALWWLVSPASAPRAAPVIHISAGSLIAAEGDSLTYGLDNAGSGLPINAAGANRSSRPWPEVLAQMLGASVTLENRGYPGDRLRDVTKRWADRPIGHLTLAQFGLSDALNLAQAEGGGLPLPEFREQLAAYVALRQSLGMQIMLITPPPLADPALEATLAPYRAALVQVGKDSGVIVIDTAAAIRGLKTPLTRDGIHLTPEANTALAGAIAARLTVD